MPRKNIEIDVEHVVEQIEDGDTVAIGGFLTSHQPTAFVRELVRQERTDLTVVAPPTSLETDLLIATECVDTVIAPYIGAEAIAPIAPWFRHRTESEQITVKESDGGQILAALEATERNLPFMPWRGGVGTSIPELNDDVKVFEDPFESQPLVAVPAIDIDVALLHCARSDKFGNVQSVGDTFADGLIARAADQTYVQVEQFVSNETVRETSAQTLASPGNVDGVVELPWGAHPFSTEGYYHADTEHLERYVDAASAAVDGDTEDWDAYLDQYVYSPSDHFDYIEKIGTAHLTTLNEHGRDNT